LSKIPGRALCDLPKANHNKARGDTLLVAGILETNYDSNELSDEGEHKAKKGKSGAYI
jgi:hypothetical protein